MRVNENKAIIFFLYIVENLSANETCQIDSLGRITSVLINPENEYYIRSDNASSLRLAHQRVSVLT